MKIASAINTATAMQRTPADQYRETKHDLDQHDDGDGVARNALAFEQRPLRPEMDELLHHVGQEWQGGQRASDQHRPLDQDDIAGDRGNVADDRIERAVHRCIKGKSPRPEQQQEEEAAGGRVVPRQVFEVVEPEDRRRHDAEPDEGGRSEPGLQAEQDACAAHQL